jgi:CheY-like chemotaxis protein
MNGNSRRGGKALQILLVEDNAGDILLTREAFRDFARPIELHVASDGLEALKFLRKEPPFTGVPRPDIILLDLKLPGMDGLEVLAQIKQDDGLRAIPAIILTVSGEGADILKSYELNGNCYLNKPIELGAFESAVKGITDFWLAKAKLPSRTIRS